MLRQVSSRSQRGKGGFKTKNVLHVCLLVAICVWLLYQMKHSHDKKKAYEERVSKLSFKDGEKRLDLASFGRKYLPHTVETEPTRESQIEEEEDEKVEHGVRREEAGDEEESGAGDHEIDGKDQEGSQRESEHGAEVTAAHEEGNKEDRTKGVDGLQDRDHEEASHKAREMSFRGDDASSEVVHIIQEVEHEEGLQEARERSFKGDDASSAVAHVPQANEPVSESEDGGSRNLDETGSQRTETKDGEIQDEGSSALTQLDDSTGNDTTAIPQGSEPSHNNTVFTRVVSPQKTTTGGESETHEKQQQPDLIIMSVINNQTDSERHSTNMTGNVVRLQTNSTSFSTNQINFLKNSTAVSIDGVAAKANLTAKWDANNVTASQNQTTSTHSVDGRTNTVELETQEPIEKDIAVGKPEESEESYKNSSATNEKVVQGNSVHSLAHGDANLPSIQNGVRKEEAAET
ncbi:hypothetical protein C4D60_Mb06t25580 [Musa balbisiana]|uniref:Uncharacterized protein n=1 Tax=Musa balbisiana TaxID=52838 RepID=A0A4S8IQS7_MUSBA|nr:hypothetical protein C4D60_Mb06t25580 [Musa balbisiana]